MDFDKANGICLIRYKIKLGKRTPLKRNFNQKACNVFLNNN